MIYIHKGDCLEYLSHIDNEVFDVALIDPPYFDYKTQHRKDKKDKLSQPLVQQSREGQLRTIQECIRVLKNNSPFFIFTNWENDWWMQERFGSFIHNKIIWDKGNWTAGNLKGSFGNKYEVILLGVKGGDWEYRGPRLPDVWGGKDDLLPRVGTKRIHSTEKPVDLYKRVLSIAVDRGAIVFDPYVGGGASAIAALELGMTFIGCEIDEEYHRRATERVYKREEELGYAIKHSLET